VKERETPNDVLISWERETIAVMESGKVLVKRDVIFRPSVFQPKPQRHSYGWRVSMKRYPTHTERVVYGAKKTAEGWKVLAP
jgi:hypothetical protein